MSPIQGDSLGMLGDGKKGEGVRREDRNECKIKEERENKKRGR